MSVYFIRAEGTPFVKIGWAVNPLKRVRELQCGSPAQLVVVRSAEGAPAAERAAHRDFADYRVKGEWFRYIDEMLTWEPPPSMIAGGRTNGHLKNEFARRAAGIVGGVNVLAEKLGISRQALYSWGDSVPAERVIPLERLTGGQLSRFDMRADIYPREPVTQP